MQSQLFRALYALEFLVAIVTALLFWNYVGGPTHLDSVPWFWKGLLPLGIATGAVRLTLAPTARQGAKWIALLMLFVTACGLLSYYAHINEPQDEDDSGDQVVPTRLFGG